MFTQSQNRYICSVSYLKVNKAIFKEREGTFIYKYNIFYCVPIIFSGHSSLSNFRDESVLKSLSRHFYINFKLEIPWIFFQCVSVFLFYHTKRTYCGWYYSSCPFLHFFLFRFPNIYI